MRTFQTLLVAIACAAVGFGAGHFGYPRNVEKASSSTSLKGEKLELTIKSARALRDGGIDAAAALNEALKEVLLDLPPEKHFEAKLATGRAIAAVLDETVNPAVRAFPELKPDDATWIAVAKASAAKRAAR